jgi:long-chain fatty acid transport protein
VRRPLCLSVALALAASSLALPDAHAGGFYLTDRGVRPLGRAGAFVAGADDPHAFWYNPAGLASAGNGVLLDASLVLFNNTYGRVAQPDPSMMPVSFRTVQGPGAPLPIPTLVVTHDFGLRDFRFAFAAYAPYAALPTYSNDRDAPQRYSLINLDGSLLALTGLFAAWRPHRTFSVGVGVSALLGSFNSQLALSGCPAQITCAPEDPDWDAVGQVNVGPIFAPTGNVGVQFTPHPMVTLGASFQLPIYVDSKASMGVRLPSHPFFDGARVVGNTANVTFALAPIARVGVEVRPTPRTRVEVAGVWEGWSVHDQLRIQPEGVRIENVRGVGTVDVGPVVLDRGFQDVFSVRVGGEQDFNVTPQWRLTARAGFAYENSATPPGYTSVLTMDADKYVATVGASLTRAPLRFDFVYAHVFSDTVTVTPREAQLFPTAPFRTSPNAPRYAVNAGSYDMSINVFGLGVRYGF